MVIKYNLTQKEKCMEIKMNKKEFIKKLKEETSLKDKIKHPFKSQDK